MPVTEEQIRNEVKRFGYNRHYEQHLILDVVHAVNKLGYKRVAIRMMLVRRNDINPIKFDYFYLPPGEKLDLRYVIDPYNWVPVRPERLREIEESERRSEEASCANA